MLRYATRSPSLGSRCFLAERFHLLEIGVMSFDLPDETSRVYRYVRQLDRHVTKLRHKAASRQPVVGFKWLRFM